jgi:hypothetical protein
MAALDATLPLGKLAAKDTSAVERRGRQQIYQAEKEIHPYGSPKQVRRRHPRPFEQVDLWRGR